MNDISRQKFLKMSSTAMAALTIAPARILFRKHLKIHTNMYGLISQMLAKPGQRDELIRILLEGTEKMPGCLSYIISKDLEDDNALWISEVWESRESHQASLSLPEVQDAITRGRPLIAGFGTRIETEPVGGFGFPQN